MGRGLVLAVVCLLGCASFPRVSRAPVEPEPRAGVRWLEGAGGVRLYFAVGLPPSLVEPWGVVFFVVGPEVGSGEPYPQLAAALAEAGLATAVVHPRGAGYSEGLRGDLEDYGLFLGDLRLGLAEARRAFPGKAVFLFGQSAGAALALEVAAKEAGPLAGVVLVNPAFRLAPAEGMGPTFGDYVTFGFNAVFRPAELTVDMNSRPEAVRHAGDRAEGLAMQRDPVVVRYFSMRYLQAQRGAMEACAVNARAVTAPMLLVEGSEDALVDPRGGEEILEAAGSKEKVKLVAVGAGHGSSAVETMVEALVGWLVARR